MPIARGIMTLSACTRASGRQCPTSGDRRDQSNQWLGDLAYHVPRALVRALRVRCRITRPSRIVRRSIWARVPQVSAFRLASALVTAGRQRTSRRSKPSRSGDRLMVDPLLTPKEASAQLGLSPAALAQLRYTGGGPGYVKLTAKAVRYRQCDLDEWIATRARTSTRDNGFARQRS